MLSDDHAEPERRSVQADEDGFSRADLLRHLAAIGLTASSVGGGLLALGDSAAFAFGSGASGKTVIDVAFGLQFEFQVGLHKGVTDQAKKSGLKMSVVDSKFNAQLQSTNSQNAIAKRPDAILFDPIDPKQISPSVIAANKAGIPAFILEAPPVQGSWLALSTWDNAGAAKIAARQLGKLTGGSGVVLECRGPYGSYQADLRASGFHSEMAAKFPNIKIKTLNTMFDSAKALTLVADALTVDSKKEVKGIYLHTDGMITGVATALAQSGRGAKVGQSGHIAMVGLDATPLALKMIRSGVLDATVQQDPFQMGGLAVVRIAQYFNGQKFPKETFLPAKLVTKANASDPKLWGNRVKG